VLTFFLKVNVIFIILDAIAVGVLRVLFSNRKGAPKVSKGRSESPLVAPAGAKPCHEEEQA